MNDNKINIYNIGSGRGRYSYKIYGKDVYRFNIYGEAHSFESFNNHNYVKSTNLIKDYHITVIDTSQVKISWYCTERHDMKVHYWHSSNPNSIYTQVSSGRNRGNNFLYIELDNPESWCFKLEGIMHMDKFIDLTNTLTF